MAKLYIVPTPIGNLDDITLRAVNVLREVDFILAEDTRTTSFLLKHLGIEQKLRSHHKFNEHATVEMVAGAIAAGRNAALVSDAGTPGISDPGFLLVRTCVEAGIEVETLPGATALIPALVQSGFPCDRFCFEGFLPQKKGRMKQLQALAGEERTMIFYESPYRVVRCLEQFAEVFGEDRRVSVSREITKKFEQTVRGTVAEALGHFRTTEPKGEFVIVVENPKSAASGRTGRSNSNRNALMEENRTDDTQKVKRSFSAWLGELREFMKGRFSLDEDKAQRDEVVASVSKGVEFRGVNLWVLIFATMIASLGLNVNSAAVIIGAMLISPIMGPIMGVGLALGINDFELLKKSLRNLALMFIVAIITSTVYFFISPLSSNSSELLARTVPTTYDVLIALFGGLAGIVAQTRQDRTSTVIPGVAIATALIPPLCTAGFGLATGQFRFFIGAFYLFFINSVFIALATYAMVRFLQYEKKVFIDKVRERTVKRLMMVITLVTFIPSVVIGFHMVRVSLFEAVADKYVSQVFNFPHTRVIECNKYYAQGKNPSQIELLLVGEPLGEEVIENARTQMRNFGLEEAELVVRQANTEDKVDVVSLQKSYQELLEEKNRRIGEMSSQLKRYRVTNVEVNDISREVGAMMDNIGAISLTKGITFDVEGTPGDTTLVCVVTPRDSALPVDRETLIRWLRIRTKVENVKLFVEP